MENFLLVTTNIPIFFAQTTRTRTGSSSALSTNLTDLLVNIGIGAVALIVLGIVLWFLFKKFADSVKTASMEKISLDSTLLEVRLPKDTEVELTDVDQMLTGFLGISSEITGFKSWFSSRKYISFEMVALPSTIRFYISVPKGFASLVEKQVNGTYPDAEVAEVEEYNLFAPGQKVEFCSLKLAEDEYKPVRIYEELSGDAVSTMTNVMSKLQPGEAMAYQIVLVPAGGGWRKDGKKYVSKVRENNSDPEKSKMDVDEDTLNAIEKKAEKPGFKADIRLVSVSTSKEVAKINLDNLVFTFDQFTKQEANKFKKVGYSKAKERRKFMKDFIYRFPRETMVLNTAELATIFHFPTATVKTPGIHWLNSKRAPADGDISSKEGDGSVYLGVNEYRGVTREVHLQRKDRRRHLYVIGKTGAGKTTFLQSMILEDIKKGRGLAYLDPHGDAVEWLLDRIPPERAEDVIYFNPADIERPIGMNVMEWYTEHDKHIVVNGFLGLLTKLFDPHNQGITGPRFEQAVRNAMLTVMAKKGTSLADVMRILQNDKAAEEYFPFLDDEVVKRYWTEQIANTQEFHKSEVLGYIVSKFDRFITNKLMRNIISQSKSGFDFREAMDSKKVVLVNLSKGLVGEENSQFLGLLLIPKMLQAAMSRADIDEDLREDFYLYVDEFQNFATPDFTQILSEARKYRLNLTVANQYIAQMTDEIREAIFGNVGSLGSFKVGVADAQHVASEFDPVFTENDIINLENYNMYIKMLSNGENKPPFSLKFRMSDPVFTAPKSKEMSELVKELSRLKYGKDRKLVEAEIKAREEGGLTDKRKAKMPSFSPPLAGGG